MSVMDSTNAIDPRPVFELIERQGGECSFEDAVNAFVALGLSESKARDVLWQLLSDGTLEFTTDRHLTMPTTLARAAG
jgi:hypothetical protein